MSYKEEPLSSPTHETNSSVIPYATVHDILLPNGDCSESNIIWVVKADTTVQSGEVVATINLDPTKPPCSSNGTSVESKPAAGLIRPKIRSRAVIRKRSISEISTVNGTSKSQPNSPVKHIGNGAVKMERSEKVFDPGARFKAGLSIENKLNRSRSEVKDPCTGMRDLTPTKATQSLRACVSGVVRIHQSPRICRKADGEIGHCIAFIEPCMHPAIIDGLCVVCGQPLGLKSAEDETSSIQPSTSSANSTHQTAKSKIQRDKLTISGGVDFRISSDYAKDLSGESSRSLQRSRKLNLILDLDHTLLHATSDPRAEEYKGKRDDVHTITLQATEGQDMSNHRPVPKRVPTMRHYVKLRPYLAEFITSVIDQYEISVYTAGTRAYANKIADLISRYVLDYHREKESSNGNDFKLCLDEEELVAMRNEVSRLEKLSDTKKRNDDSVSEEVTPSKNTRKKVTFGELPKYDSISQRLDKAKDQLQKAEFLEKEAMALRQKIFGTNRIISRTDVADLGRDVKSLKRVFPCGGMLAAIVDDREDVWANAENNSEPPDNLLLVRPYHWKSFVHFADVNNAAGQDITKMGETEKNHETSDSDDDDRQLLWTSDILKRLHERYYNEFKTEVEGTQSITVPSILKKMRNEVFGKSIHLLLSGLVPLHNQRREWGSNPRPPVVRYAETLGANVLYDVSDELTHVVAARDGTDKVLRARKVPGCFVLKVSWLMECYWSLTNRSVLPHILGAFPSQNFQNETKESPLSTKSGATSETEVNQEDASSSDDFFDELEKELMM